ncbi:hypothetical protein SprV_0802574500 [Sparganum proliferum]
MQHLDKPTPCLSHHTSSNPHGTLYHDLPQHLQTPPSPSVTVISIIPATTMAITTAPTPTTEHKSFDGPTARRPDGPPITTFVLTITISISSDVDSVLTSPLKISHSSHALAWSVTCES